MIEFTLNGKACFLCYDDADRWVIEYNHRRPACKKCAEAFDRGVRSIKKISN